MKKQMLLFVVLMSAVLICSLWAGADQETADSESVVLHVMTGWNENAFPNWGDRIQQFEAEHPNITVEIEWSSGDFGAIQQLRTAFLVGEAPEIVHVWKTDFNQYAAEGLLYPLNDFLKKQGWSNGHFYDGAYSWAAKLDEAISAETYYGLPDYIFPSVFYYNVDIFDELNIKVPTNLDELKGAIDTIRAAGKKGLIVSAAAAGALTIMADIQVQTAGVRPLIDAYTGKGTMMDPGLMKAAEIFEEIASYIEPISISLGSADAQSMFGSGEAAILAAHTGHQIGIQAAADVSGINWSVFTNLEFVPNPVNPFSVTFGGLWATPVGNKHLEETYEFLSYMFSEEVMGETASMTNRLTNIPGANLSIDDPILELIANDILPRSSVESFFMVDMVLPKVRDEMMRGIQEMIQGNLDAVSLMKAAQEALEASR